VTLKGGAVGTQEPISNISSLRSGSEAFPLSGAVGGGPLHGTPRSGIVWTVAQAVGLPFQAVGLPFQADVRPSSSSSSSVRPSVVRPSVRRRRPFVVVVVVRPAVSEIAAKYYS
jgi:hypothetical protein